MSVANFLQNLYCSRFCLGVDGNAEEAIQYLTVLSVMTSWRRRTDCFAYSHRVAAVRQSTSSCNVVDARSLSTCAAGCRRVVHGRHHVTWHEAASPAQLANVETISVLVAYDLHGTTAQKDRQLTYNFILHATSRLVLSGEGCIRDAHQRNQSKYLKCAQKLSGRQISLPHKIGN